MLSATSLLTIGNGLYTILASAYALTVVGVALVVVSENRNPVKSLAWVSVLLLLPVLGLVLYFVFGRSIRNRRMISRRTRRHLRRKESFRKVRLDTQNISQESKQLIQLSRSLCSAIYYPCNTVKAFVDGGDKFESLLRDIDKATTCIDVQYYIISDDDTGQRLQQALIAKAKSGVAVRLLYDSLGSIGTPTRFFKKMEDAGVKVHSFFRITWPFGEHINWRNHRKICIIDGKIGYIGGMNVADRYIGPAKGFPAWRDTHLRIIGPAVGALQYSFAVDWNFVCGEIIDEPQPEDPGADNDNKGYGMQLLTSGPMSQWPHFSLFFLKAIGTAKKRVFLQTPYFLPSDALLKALQSAALSGVDVRVMMPKRSDSRLLDAASYSYISHCLQSGIKVYLYEAGMMHAKMLLVDDELTSIGSTNFDFRSFEHNFEANMQTFSAEFNKEMADIFLSDTKQCLRIDMETWKKRSAWQKAKESVARLLSPIM